jgi:hypothetical protein
MSKERARPACECGATDWEERGGVFGGLCQRNYKCKNCNRAGVSISGHGGNIFMTAAMPGAMTEKAIDWFNSTVLPSWRSNCTTGIPKYGERVPTPPRVPGEDVIVWIEHVTPSGDSFPLVHQMRPDTSWERVDPESTQSLPIPPDPIRVNHDALFNSIFLAVGIPESARKEIPNRYYNDKSNKEPWYSIRIGEVEFTVGPRKRVIAIELTRPDGKDFDEGQHPFGHRILNDLATKDRTTYSASEATISVHAWGKDKAIEYLGILVAAAVPVLDRMAEI